MSTATAPPPTVSLQRPTTAAPARMSPRRRILVAALVVVLLVAVGAAVVIGTQRMFRAAPIASVDATTGQQVVGYEWSSWPLGFTVRYADGSRATHLWW